jgi:hypothetical protein
MNKKPIYTDFLNAKWKPVPMFYGFKTNVQPYILPRNRGKLPMPKSGHIQFGEVAAVAKAEFNPLPNKPELQLPGKIFNIIPAPQQKFLNAATVKLINSGKVKAEFRNQQKINPLSMPIVSQMSNSNLKLISLEMIKNSIMGLKYDPALGTEQQQLQARSAYDNLIVCYASLVDRKQDNPINVQKIIAQYEKEMVAIYGQGIKKSITEDILNETLGVIKSLDSKLIRLYEMITNQSIHKPEVEQEAGGEGEGEGEGGQQGEAEGEAGGDGGGEFKEKEQYAQTVAGESEEIAARWYNNNYNRLKAANFNDLYKEFSRAMTKAEIENIIMACLGKITNSVDKKKMYYALMPDDKQKYDLRNQDDKEAFEGNVKRMIVEPAVEYNYGAQSEKFGVQVPEGGAPSLPPTAPSSPQKPPPPPPPPQPKIDSQLIASKWYDKYKGEGFKVKNIFDDLYTFFPDVPMNEDTVLNIIETCVNLPTVDELQDMYHANVNDPKIYDLDTEAGMVDFVENLNTNLLSGAASLNHTAHMMRLVALEDARKQKTVEQFKLYATENKALARPVIEKLKANVEKKKKKIDTIKKNILIRSLVKKRKARKGAKVKAETEAKVKTEAEAQAKVVAEGKTKAITEGKTKGEIRAQREEAEKSAKEGTQKFIDMIQGLIKQEGAKANPEIIAKLVKDSGSAANAFVLIGRIYDTFTSLDNTNPNNDLIARFNELISKESLGEINNVKAKLTGSNKMNRDQAIRTMRDETISYIPALIELYFGAQGAEGRKRKSRKRPTRKSVKKLSADVNNQILRLLRS